MRLILLALLVSAGRLAAQHPPSVNTSKAILRAAARDTAERLVALRVAGDTAWATVVNPHDVRRDESDIPGREVRLLRRAGSWAVVATRPVVVTPLPGLRTGPVVRPAGPFSVSDTLPKRP